MGAWAAVESGISLRLWLSLDCLIPDRAWIANCSIRPSETVTPHFRSVVQKYFQEAPGCEQVAGDMLDVPLRDSSVDLYLAIYSWYQVPDRERLLAEALRVTRPGGIVAVTDNFVTADLLVLAPPGAGGHLRTVAWVKEEQSISGPIRCFHWTKTDLSAGREQPGLAELRTRLKDFYP